MLGFITDIGRESWSLASGYGRISFVYPQDTYRNQTDSNSQHDTLGNTVGTSMSTTPMLEYLVSSTESDLTTLKPSPVISKMQQLPYHQIAITHDTINLLNNNEIYGHITLPDNTFLEFFSKKQLQLFGFLILNPQNSL